MRHYGTVDFHAHPVTAAFRESLSALGIDPIQDNGFPLPAWSAETHLDFMREAGIAYAALSIPAPHVHNGDDKKSCEAARIINEELSEIVKSYSDSFTFTAVLPLPCVEGAVAETAYAMEELGAVGVKAATSSNGVYLGDKSLDPLMEELNRRNALALLNPGTEE